MLVTGQAANLADLAKKPDPAVPYVMRILSAILFQGKIRGTGLLGFQTAAARLVLSCRLRR